MSNTFEHLDIEFKEVAMLRGQKGDKGDKGDNPTTQQIQSAVDEWFDEHPEATSTVTDGEITAPKLSGVTEPEDLIEYTGYYLANSTGTLTANSSYSVTKLLPVEAGEYIIMGGRAYGNSYDQKRTYAFYESDGETVVSCTYQASGLTDGAEVNAPGLSTTWGYVPNNNSIAYVRFTVPNNYLGQVFFLNPKKEDVTCSDNDLNKAIGTMASGNLLDASVSLNNLDFIIMNRYNKIRYDKRIRDLPIFENGAGYSNDFPYNGIYESELVAGELYWASSNVKSYIVLMCYDSDGNYIGRSNVDAEASNIFESYEAITVNYSTHYEFELKSSVATTYISLTSNSTYNYGKCLICLKSEYNQLKSIDDCEITTNSEAFVELIRNIQTSIDPTVLNGKVWIALGDSYTSALGSAMQSLASQYGMILDNRGIVSSTICGDRIAVGNKGYHPMWERADNIVSDYTNGHTISGTSYSISDVGLITFMGGANDGFGVETWIGTGIHETDTGTIYGACNHIFSVLQETFTSAKMICITQPSCYNRVNDVSDAETAQILGFDSLAEVQAMTDVQFSNYAMAQKETAVRNTAWAYGLPILDMFNEFPSIHNPSNRSTYWQGDKLHMTNAGNKVIIDAIADKIKEVFS